MIARRTSVASGRVVANPIALAALGLAIVILDPGGLNRWVVPKLLLLAIAALFAAFGRPRGRLPWPVWGGIGIAAVELVISAALHPGTGDLVTGRWPRYEGLVAGVCYVLALWVGARLLGPGRSRVERESWERVMSLVAVAIAVVALLETVGLRPIPSDLARPGSLLGNATDQGIVGAILAIALIPAAFRATDGTPREHVAPRSMPARTVVVVGLLAAVLATMLSGSRAAILSLGIAGTLALVAIVVLASPRHRRSRVARAGVLATAALAMVAATPLVRDRLTGASPLAAQTVDDRWELWRAAVDALATSPWLGFGPSGFVTAVRQFLPLTWFDDAGGSTVADSPHNVVLQVASAGGLALVGIVVVLTGIAVTLLVRRLAAARRILARPPDRVAAPEEHGSRGRARRASRERLEHEVRQLARTDLDVVFPALAVLAFAGALLTHFTVASTTMLALALLGSAIALPPDPDAPWRRAAGRGVSSWLHGARILGLTALVVLLGGFLVAEHRLADAAVAARSGDLDAAVSALEDARALRLGDPDVTLIGAELFAVPAAAVAGSPAAPLAIEWGTESKASFPNEPRAMLALAIGLASEGDLGAAIRQLEAAQAVSPQDPDLYRRSASYRAARGDLEGALADLRSAAVRAPSDESLRDDIAKIEAAILGSE